MPLISNNPANSPTDGASRLVFVAPPQSELPSGFPFTSQIVDGPEQVLRAVLTFIDGLPDDKDAPDVPPLVLILGAKPLEFLIDIAAALELRVRMMSGLETEYEGYWSILSSGLPHTSVQELMETRRAEDHSDRSTGAQNRKQPKDFEQSLSKLRPPSSAPASAPRADTTVSEPADDAEVD